MRKWFVTFGCTLAFAGLIVTAGIAVPPQVLAGMGAAPTHLDINADIGEDLEWLDVTTYAEEYGVSDDEAQRRLAAQVVISTIEEDLLAELGPSLTYVRILHKPVYSVEIGVASDDSTAVRSVDTVLDQNARDYGRVGLGRIDFATVETAHHRADLEGAVNRLPTLLADVGAPVH